LDRKEKRKIQTKKEALRTKRKKMETSVAGPYEGKIEEKDEEERRLASYVFLIFNFYLFP